MAAKEQHRTDREERDEMSNLIEQIRTQWNRNLEEEDNPVAVSFVMAGRNNFEDRGHAEKIARIFSEATGVPCIAHVVAAQSDDRILSVATTGRRYVAALECITMIDEALRAA